MKFAYATTIANDSIYAAVIRLHDGKNIAVASQDILFCYIILSCGLFLNNFPQKIFEYYMLFHLQGC